MPQRRPRPRVSRRKPWTVTLHAYGLSKTVELTLPPAPLAEMMSEGQDGTHFVHTYAMTTFDKKRRVATYVYTASRRSGWGQ